MKDVIELAKQAGFQKFLKPADRPEMICDPDAIERFYALVRNAALEQAAQACEADHKQAHTYDDEGRSTGLYSNALTCAAVIRNIKEPTP